MNYQLMLTCISNIIITDDIPTVTFLLHPHLTPCNTNFTITNITIANTTITDTTTQNTRDRVEIVAHHLLAGKESTHIPALIGHQRKDLHSIPAKALTQVQHS